MAELFVRNTPTHSEQYVPIHLSNCVLPLLNYTLTHTMFDNMCWTSSWFNFLPLLSVCLSASRPFFSMHPSIRQFIYLPISGWGAALEARPFRHIVISINQSIVAIYWYRILLLYQWRCVAFNWSAPCVYLCLHPILILWLEFIKWKFIRVSLVFVDKFPGGNHIVAIINEWRNNIIRSNSVNY